MPGFALNNLLSNVPLLGPLLTGGKNGGVFAISYRLDGPLDALKTDVNMMAAVTPGALRELFEASAAACRRPGPSNRARLSAEAAQSLILIERDSAVPDDESSSQRGPGRGACGRPTA